MKIASFDIDGVLHNGPGLPGIYPGPNDIIVTGRSWEEQEETMKMLESKGIKNIVYFNKLAYNDKTRETSGFHKAHVFNDLRPDVIIHYEDDPVQAQIIQIRCRHLTVILLNNPLVNKENQRHYEF